MAKSGLFTGVLVALLFAPLGAQDVPVPTRLRGVDHFMWVVRDLEVAQVSMRDSLGFAFVGSRNKMANLENFLVWFEDGTFLELLHPYTTSSFSGAVHRFLARQEGAWKIAFNAEPLQPLYERFRELTLNVSAPTTGTYVAMNDREGLPETMWHSLTLVTPPGNYMFFWHFTLGWEQMRSAVPDLDPQRIHEHPNTALGLRTAWVAVWDLDYTLASFQRLGLVADVDSVNVQQLGAVGRRLKFEKGDLLFLQPLTFDSPVSDFLVQRGENLMGISIEVADLERARERISEGLGESLHPYEGVDGLGILVPPESAHGLYLEFFQRRP